MVRTFSLASFVVALCGLSCFSAEARPDSKMTFEVYKGKNDQYRWRLKDGDDTVATGGQGYKAKGRRQEGHRLRAETRPPTRRPTSRFTRTTPRTSAGG